MTTRCIWVIETDVFEITAPKIIAALESSGQPWMSYSEARNLTFPTDGPLVFWGSLGAAYVDGVTGEARPGAIGDVSEFRCSCYYGALQDLKGVQIANGNAVFTTVRQLTDDPKAALAGTVLETAERIFVRPDSPLKPFAGRTVLVDALSPAALDHGFYYEDFDLPVAASPLQTLGREWRFVVVEGKVVAGCEYIDSREGVGTDIPEACQEVADRIARARWTVAPVYVLDIVETGQTFSLMELNPFSGADLYDCDAAKIVEAVSDWAERDFYADSGLLVPPQNWASIRGRILRTLQEHEIAFGPGATQTIVGLVNDVTGDPGVDWKHFGNALATLVDGATVSAGAAALMTISKLYGLSTSFFDGRPEVLWLACADLAAARPFDFNRVSRLLHTDLLHNYYRSAARRIFEEGGVDSVVAYIRSVEFLDSPGLGVWVSQNAILPLVREQLHRAFPDLRRLQAEFPEMKALQRKVEELLEAQR